MATATEYSQGLLDQEVEPVEAPSYEANTTELNVPTDTVSGQMDSLLDKDSQWMRRANTKGKQYANTRGLLNSSIGAQAAQAAAIDAALPIAQQDSSSYLAQKLTNQEATNKALGLGTELESKSNIANASNEAALQRELVHNQAVREQQSQAEDATLRNLNISEGATTARNDANNIARDVMNNSNLAADDRLRFGNYYSTRSTTNLSEITRITEDPDLTPEEKNTRMIDLNTAYKADIQLMSDLFAIPLDMVGQDYYE